ncbi:RES family NAD+ phosphorylase [Leucobacter coleopterorum]|uniref:RES family NAD+ phosphorylase n=1 Tax=Leucobacter coleopterorum TaxID=2714933 RepID=A0ABX6JWB0_9MICO|nr:RES family NAD+ phosphorylase [Leucobacter coleopterorum]QIM18528.1 RES family NAD+ phosphorylase [Leucobacter coleopterorum]
MPGARKGKPGHWSFVPPHQVHGRWDNTELYDSWYFSRTPLGAVAESFYNKQRWIPEVFLTPAGNPRAIAEFSYEGPDSLDLDDAATLLELSARPSEIVIRDLGRTQALARDVYEASYESRGGLSWWSAQLPSETSVMLWGSRGAPPEGLKLVGIQALSTEHPAVMEAATQLYRRLG